MTNMKNIAATLALLGSVSLMGCNKDKPATETPGGAEAAPVEEAVEEPGEEPGVESPVDGDGDLPGEDAIE